MKLSVIITTYNSEEWLQKVLLGFTVQTEKDFEVVIADDGSTSKTADLIQAYQAKFKNPILHVWQEDKGFRKSRILNKAILRSNSDYLLFTDGDCIPREDYVAVHFNEKEKGYFLSGGYFKLPMTISKVITYESILSQKCFKISWLLKQGIKVNFKVLKLAHNNYFAAFMNWITPTKRSWNGHNSSGWKSDLIAVNGFNEEMNYGGMDRELGERLFYNGMLSKQIRYSAICLHLDHGRNYSSPEIWKKNNSIRAYNRKNRIITIEKGINKIL